MVWLQANTPTLQIPRLVNFNRKCVKWIKGNLEDVRKQNQHDQGSFINDMFMYLCLSHVRNLRVALEGSLGECSQLESFSMKLQNYKYECLFINFTAIPNVQPQVLHAKSLTIYHNFKSPTRDAYHAYIEHDP